MISHDFQQTLKVGEGVKILSLTPRQLEVIAVIADGNSEKQTARILSISRATVHRHIVNACRKNKLNRIQLIVAFAQWQVMEGREQ